MVNAVNAFFSIETDGKIPVFWQKRGGNALKRGGNALKRGRK
jgi:hypothetical protein